MNTQARYLLIFLFLLIPLSYSIDEDPYRALEVLFWGGVMVLIAVSTPIRYRQEPEFLLIAAYCAVLTFQQSFIPDGRVWFGAQYALVFVAAFVPSFVLRWTNWSAADFEKRWDLAMKLLSVVILVNIAGGRFLGWGEFYINNDAGGRYFGFLGDAISPVIIFPLIYFFLERRYSWVTLMLGAMVLTGGKAAAVMLLAAPVLFVVARMRPFPQLISIVALSALAIVSQSLINELLLMISNDPRVSYSFNTRVLSYLAGWDYFLSSPIYGVGINQSMNFIRWDADALARYRGVTEYWNIYQIHNSFVRTLAETGILGFGILIGFCFILIRRSFKALRVAVERPPSRTRSLVIASGLWTALFIVTYHSTGWFEHGHPQFAWLLVIGSLAHAGARARDGADAR